jgi:hypothetical protein
MQKLIKSQNQRSAIFLRKTGGDLTLASFVVFDDLNNAKLVGQKILKLQELQNILYQKDALANRNIFVIEEPEDDAVVLLGSNILRYSYSPVSQFINSPYFSNLFREAEFFSTQKTRGPNI